MDTLTKRMLTAAAGEINRAVGESLGPSLESSPESRGPSRVTSHKSFASSHVES